MAGVENLQVKSSIIMLINTTTTTTNIIKWLQTLKHKPLLSVSKALSPRIKKTSTTPKLSSNDEAGSTSNRLPSAPTTQLEIQRDRLQLAEVRIQPVTPDDMDYLVWCLATGRAVELPVSN